MYAFSNRVLKNVRQKLIKLQGEIDESTITAGDFKIPISETDRMTRIENTINQQDTTHIYRSAHPTMLEYIHFLSIHATYAILSHQRNLNKF